jgi:hypothetical protein
VGGTSDNVTNIYAPDNSSAILMAYWTNNVSGTVSTAVGSAVVTGVGTKFTTSVAVGDQFAIGQLAGPLPKVISITSDNQLTVDSSFATVANGANYVVYNSRFRTGLLPTK